MSYWNEQKKAMQELLEEVSKWPSCLLGPDAKRIVDEYKIKKISSVLAETIKEMDALYKENNIIKEDLFSEERLKREGHGALCYYCKEECNSLAGNPGMWPIPLCHEDEPGVVKWHHIECVSRRLK